MHIDKLALAQREPSWLSTEQVARHKTYSSLCLPPNTSSAIPPPSPLLSPVGHLAVRALELSRCPLACPSAATERHSLPASSPPPRAPRTLASHESPSSRCNLLSPFLFFFFSLFRFSFLLASQSKLMSKDTKGAPGGLQSADELQRRR